VPVRTAALALLQPKSEFLLSRWRSDHNAVSVSGTVFVRIRTFCAHVEITLPI
jgi:hypothetical protein